jgi:hypothetical protein
MDSSFLAPDKLPQVQSLGTLIAGIIEAIIMIVGTSSNQRHPDEFCAAIYLHKPLTTSSYVVPSGGSGNVLVDVQSNLPAHLPAPWPLVDLSILC